MKRLLWLCLLSLCLACNNGGFGGTSGKKSSSNGDDDAGGEAASDTDKDGNDDGDKTDGDDLIDGALDENGTLTDECRVVTDLPGEVTKPVELFHWVASGQNLRDRRQDG